MGLSWTDQWIDNGSGEAKQGGTYFSIIVNIQLLIEPNSIQTHPAAHLVHSQVDAGVRYDTQHVGQVSSVEGQHAFFSQDLPGAVGNPSVLPCPSECETSLQHLHKGGHGTQGVVKGMCVSQQKRDDT